MSAKSFPAEPATAFPESVHCAPLAHLQVLEFRGADALTFLHGQLTQDVQGLTAQEARLAAYCSVKGRMLASLVMWRVQAEDGSAAVRAMVDASVAQALVKRLRMFVLRAKVTIDAVDVQVSGVWADTGAALDALDAWAGGIPNEAWQRADHTQGTWIAAPRGQAAPAGRWWYIAPAANTLPATPALPANAADAWREQDIEAGLPWVSQPLQDLITPLVANFDLIGGVSFTKGCYPGQEVVARSHYLGKQKRRSMLAHIAPQTGVTADQAVGADIYQAGSTGEPVGRVINAAGQLGGVHLLFEAPVAIADTAELRLGTPDGPMLVLAKLPYSLAAES